ncbi:pentapeptide repeat-containing protein [Nemorincola caseinilytica]|uniref:Pentapeptide repeat-containing protein n=2 Tax=Nemorincola caseinilytica TaxID=2054315 RepID=A0ABP8NJT8_9BACT
MTFDRAALAEKPLTKGEYDNCTFTGCDLSGADLSGMRFIQCTFTGCNLSMARITKTVWMDATFKDCKMLGLRWDSCDPFGLALMPDGCVMDHSSFYGVKLRKAVFRHTQMRETDLTECDLTGATLHHCDLAGATFDNTILEKADLSTALNYTIDPDRNKIKKAHFALHGLPGLLAKYDIRIDI